MAVYNQVYNEESGILVSGTAGNDSIHNDYYGDSATVDAGDGADIIYNEDADNVSINGGAGNDYIYNDEGYSATIEGGDGDDTIVNTSYSSDSSISGGAGNDSISNSSSDVTIDGGAGNDKITNSGSNVLFQYTGGNDVIQGFNSSSTLQIMSGSVSDDYSSNGIDLVLTIGVNTVTLKGVGNVDHINMMDSLGNAQTFVITPVKSITGTDQAENISNSISGATINALGGDDTINNNGEKVSILSGAGDDSIYNDYYGKSVTIDAGDGADTINNHASNVSINSGAGNDYIDNSYDDVTINSGDGDDTISNHSSNVTIDAGAGIDFIENDGDNVLFKYAGGNDIIQGFNASSTLQIMSGTIKNCSWSGIDAILTIGENTVTLKGVGQTTNVVNIIDVDGNVKENFTLPPATITGTANPDNISNEIYGAIINALGGDDTIDNIGAKASISGGAGNDSIYNNSSSDSVTIDSGDGNDTINNNSSEVSINAGAGNDSIYNGSSYVTINAGAGDDTIENYYYSSNVLFQYAGGNDIIEGFRSDSTLQIMSGSIKSGAWSNDDAILTIGENTVTLKGLKDTTNRINIINAAGNSEKFVIPITISGTANSDNIDNDKSDVIIDALGGGDNINNSGDNVSINGGDGHDNIFNTGNDSTILGGAGDDTISNSYRYYSYDEYGNAVIIDGGDGNDSIENYQGNSVTIDGGAGNDFIYNEKGNNSTILGGAGSDAIENSGGSKVLIDAGDGNDQIINVRSGNNVALNSTILGGAGNDVISNNADNVTISGGEGDDLIINYYTTDEENSGDLVSGNNVTFQHVSGNDLIQGFNESSVLEIGNGNDTYSTVKSGNDVVVTVGENKITLDGAASLSNLHIVGEEIELAPSWKLNGTMATYGTKSNTLITITGVRSANGIVVNNNKTVTIPLSSLSNLTVSIIGDGYKLALAGDVPASKTMAAHWDGMTYKSASITGGYSIVNNQIVYTPETAETDLFTISGVTNTDGIIINDTTVTVPLSALGIGEVTVSNGYTLALGNDVTHSTSTPAHWSGSTYKSESTTEGYNLVDNKVTYTPAKVETDLFTINGVISTEGIAINGITVTVSKSALSTSNVTISNGYALALASDVPASKSTAAHWDGMTYKSASDTAGYSLSNNQIIYTPAEKAETDLFTINGVTSTNGIVISGKTVTVPQSALSTNNVTISDGYTLAIASDVPLSNTMTAHWSGTTYKSASATGGYSIVNNQIVYTPTTAETDLFTINGVTTTDGITINGTTVTVPKSALGIGEVTINNGYTLSTGSGITHSTSIPAHFSGTTYKSESTTEGYNLVDNKITYTPAKVETDLFTISGVKSTDGITVNGITVTVPQSALGTSNVTINNGYALVLAGDVRQAQVTAAHFDGMTYKSASNVAGYSVVNNQIVYTAAKAETDLFTINGVKNTEGITVKGKTVTVPLSALNNANVSISNGYSLETGLDVAQPKTTKGWSFKNSVATYAQTKTAGYTLAKDAKSITYSKEVVKDLIKVNGVKSADGLSLKDKVVTVSKASLGTKKVTISKGYTLAFGIDVTKPQSVKATWSHKGTTATYKSSSSVAGYKLAKNGSSITYSTGAAASTLATITGIKADATPTVKGNVITLTKANLSSKKASVNGKGYEFSFAKDNYAKAEIKGNKGDDQITSNGSNLSIIVGTGNDTVKALGTSTTVTAGKGNDSIISNKTGGNVFVYANGDGNDVITNFANSDKISIKSGTASITPVGKDVVFTIGKGKITVKGGIGKKITYIDKTGEHTYPKNGVSLSSAAVNLSSDYSENVLKATDYGDAIQTINASAVTHKLTITANKLANDITGSTQDDSINGGAGTDIIRGGAGNDTLIGSAGNDTLTGGNGADIFIYADGNGNDVITDYKAEDKIQITKGTAKVSKSGKDVIFTVGKGKITVKGAAEKVVTYINEKGKTNYYPAPTKDSMIVSGTTVKLLEQYKSGTFDVSNVKNGNKVEMIDAADASNNLKIVGNAKNNLVLGGKGNDTIYGGKGNDTLQGDNGKNVFVYANGDGNDVIIDYNTGDKINLTSGAMGESSVKGNDFVFKVGKGKITLTNGADKVIAVVDKNGNNKIVGNDKADVIIGGKGNDTLTGNAGNDTLTGGNGADIFVYANGNGKDIITDYTEEDKIQITQGKATVKKSGKDVIFTVGKGKISVKGAADKIVTYIDASGKTNYYPAPTKDSVIINGTTAKLLGEYKSDTFNVSKVKNGSKVKEINAADVSSNLKIVGNAKANLVLGGAGNNSLLGNKGADTLQGGKGNDSLWGGAGNDTFIYAKGDGNDTIFDYASGNLLQIVGGSFSKSSYKEGTLTLTVGKGSITMENITTSTDFNINGKTYHISGKKLVK
ncbi:MAG: calcium-binding protein [Selenomonadaceae bacterium]|nr:calcium-binding protein [Selenomonadaceae bacterium]